MCSENAEDVLLICLCFVRSHLLPYAEVRRALRDAALLGLSISQNYIVNGFPLAEHFALHDLFSFRQVVRESSVQQRHIEVIGINHKIQME